MQGFLEIALAFVAGLLLGRVFAAYLKSDSSSVARRKKEDPPPPPSSDDDEEEIDDDSSAAATRDEEHKMVVVVRTDLKMGAGKTAAQCSHAVLGAYRKAAKASPGAVMVWSAEGQAKVVLRCAGEDELLSLQRAAKAAHLPHFLVADAGRTQIAAGSLTALAIGPALRSRVDAVTGHLKLLN